VQADLSLAMGSACLAMTRYRASPMSSLSTSLGPLVEEDRLMPPEMVIVLSDPDLRIRRFSLSCNRL